MIRGRSVNRVVSVAKVEQLKRLQSFFPGLSEGRESPEANPWDNSLTIRFRKADGGIVTVSSDFDFWTEGDGDWAVANPKQFRVFIQELSANSDS